MVEGSHNNDRGDGNRNLIIPVLNKAVEVAGSTPIPVQSTENEDTIDLLEYWRVLVRRRWTVFSILSIAMVVTVLITFLMTPIYRSTVVLQIEREAGKVMKKYEEIAPEEGGWDSREFYQTQYQLLGSRNLARKVIDRLGMELTSKEVENPTPSFIKELRATISGWLQNSKPEQVQKPDFESVFLANLTIEPVKNSRLVKVSYDSPDPKQAAQIANTLAQEYINSSLERRFEAASYAKNFLEQRIRQVRTALEDSEKKLISYAKEKQIINLEDKQEIIMQTIKELNRLLVEAERERIEAEAENEQLNKVKGTGFSKILESPVIQALKQRKAALQTEYEEQLKVFKPGYPRMQQLEQQILEVNKEIESEMSAIRSAVKATYQAKVQREAKLRASLTEAKQQILSLQEGSRDYQIIKRDVDTNRELYDGLLQRLKEVGVVAGTGLNNISVVDAAEVPRFRYKPDLTKYLAISIVLGLFVGILFAFLFEALDDAVKTVKDIEGRFTLPVLGVIPYASSDEDDSNLADVALASATAPRSHLAEAYRSLQTALAFSTARGAPKVLHLTSAGPGEGKSVSAANVAIGFAQTGRKVLLIDADLRDPSLHKAFEVPNSLGLTNYLAGEARPSEVTQASTVPRLFLATSGPIPPNPVELLTSAKMMDLIALARERFDHVVIDGPPLLGLADAVVLSQLAEGTVLVAKAGVTKKIHLEGAIKRLLGTRVKLVGSVLTMVSERRGGYGYGYGYGYSYNYHYGYGAPTHSDKRHIEGKIA